MVLSKQESPRPRYEVEILYSSWEDTHLFIFYANVIWCGCICLYECVSPCVSMSVRVSAVHVWRSEDIFRWQPLPPSLFCDRASSCSPLWHQVNWPMSFCFCPHHVVEVQRLQVYTPVSGFPRVIGIQALAQMLTWKSISLSLGNYSLIRITK